MARIDVEEVAHRALAALLASDPITHVFAAHLAAERPDGLARAAVIDGVARAAIVGGPHHGVPSAYYPWLVATSELAVRELLARHGHGLPDGLQLRAEHAAAARAVLPDVTFDAEVMLRREPGASRSDARINVRRLGAVIERGVPIDEELRRLIGDPADFARDAPFWCLVEDQRVVAIAETMAHVGDTVAVQQVYTAEPQRGRGRAAALIRAVFERYPTTTCFVWLTAESNAPSRALAAKLGFVEHARVLSMVATA